MISVKTYISNPSINRPGYVGYEHIEKYFLSIEDGQNRENIRNILECGERGGNIYGCILITYGDRVIMDDEIIERFPLYWLIWVDLIGDYLTILPEETQKVSREPYFSLKKTDDSHIIFNYSDYYVSKVPENEMLKSLLLAAKFFFQLYQECSGDDVYLSTCKKIDRLLPLVDNL